MCVCACMQADGAIAAIETLTMVKILLPEAS